MAMIGIVALAGTAMAQGGDVIAQRREGMKRMAQHMQAMKAVVDNRGDVKGTVERIDDMLAWYRDEPKLFPAGSDKGDTRALPAIWSDHAGFLQANATMIFRVQQLRTAAAGGDQAAFAQAYQDTSAACGACHRPYRAPSR
jgi:cytochrome c556